MPLSPARFICLLFSCLLAGCTGDSARSVSAPAPAATFGQTVATGAQLNQVMEQAVMSLSPVMTFRCSGNMKQILENSYWKDYTNAYRYKSSAEGEIQLTLDLTDAARMLAASRNPALEPRLTTTERKALAKARRIVEGNRRGSRFDTIVSLHDALVELGETRRLHMPTASMLLLDGVGDCWSYSLTMHLLLQMAGIPAHIVTGTGKGIPHSWNIVQLDNGEWYHIDTTWDDPIVRNFGSTGIPSHRYFLICDTHMRKDHTWATGAYPKSGTNHATYFKNRRIYFTDYDELWLYAISVFRQGHLGFEAWLGTAYNEAAFKIGMNRAAAEAPRLRSCAWIAPEEGREGSIRIQFR